MKLFPMLGLTLLAIFIYGVESSRTKGLKMKAAIAMFTGISCVLGILLVWFPNLPGPTDAIMPIFKPINKIIGAE
ncbi:hypothetical protein [Paenibacillus sp. y28]|uniref:hypothetical protein n=1 Tax=Paenibacillus sp. y28 TaxID=3129110 RepID=UPI0030178A59